MTYKLRFVQEFKQYKEKEFMELEKRFIQLEREIKEFPIGKRYIPFIGREPANTLIWECEFPSFEEVQQALSFIEKDPRHEELYKIQVQYFTKSYTEIYKVVDL